MAKTSRQTARQWIVTHEWMVNPMQQTEWIEDIGSRPIARGWFP